MRSDRFVNAFFWRFWLSADILSMSEFSQIGEGLICERC